MSMGTAQIIKKAKAAGVVVPAFNVPHLEMVEPLIRAVEDQDDFALLAVARLEWIKFRSKSLRAVFEEFTRWENPDHVRLHLDHVPVIDEDNLPVDYLPLIREAIELGYQSVMVDGSRLSLAENIKATSQVTELAHKAGIPCEAELGAVLGHEAGPIPPYEELFDSGRGFTNIIEAERFVRETGCDWLSVAIGNIHGAVSTALKDKEKVAARLNLDHLAKLARATNIPLVLHGGSGVRQQDILKAVKLGIAKVNIGTEGRQTYERALREKGRVTAAQEAVYKRTCFLLKDYFGLTGSRGLLVEAAP